MATSEQIRLTAADYVQSFRAEFDADPDLDDASDREHCDAAVTEMPELRGVSLEFWRSTVQAEIDAAPIFSVSWRETEETTAEQRQELLGYYELTLYQACSIARRCHAGAKLSNELGFVKYWIGEDGSYRAA